MKLWQSEIRVGHTFKGFFGLFITGVTLCGAIASCAPNAPTNSSSPSPSGSTPNPTSGSPSATAQKGEVTITLVSFAVTKAAHEAIIPKFVEKWKKEHNQTVVFNQSYGGSGSQTRAVVDGLEADVVHLALGLDVSKIEKAGLIQPGWEKRLPNDAIVSKTVAALVTRDGNPKGIKNWNDLAKDGVQLITADPKTSGIARWNFLALWNASIKNGDNDAKATEYVTTVYKGVPILTKDAREASDVFYKQGQGDVLINYENEIILASQKGEKLPYIIPDVNVSIDNPIAVVDKNVDKHGTREVAQAFVQYLFTPEAQQEFAKIGFRPIDPTQITDKALLEKFPPVKNLATVQEFGGWGEVQKKFFADGAIFDQMQSSFKK